MLEGTDVVMKLSAPSEACLEAALQEDAPPPPRWRGSPTLWEANLVIVRPIIVVHAGTSGWPHPHAVHGGGGGFGGGHASGRGGAHAGGGGHASGSAHDGGSGGGDWGKLGPVVVIAAVVALTALPIVADVFSVLSPSGSASADAIDQVNAWNDYTRATGTCAASP